MPLTQQPLLPHVFPAQHCSPDPPHEKHVTPMHTAPALHVLLAQQASVGAPQVGPPPPVPAPPAPAVPPVATPPAPAVPPVAAPPAPAVPPVATPPAPAVP